MPFSAKPGREPRVGAAVAGRLDLAAVQVGDGRHAVLRVRHVERVIDRFLRAGGSSGRWFVQRTRTGTPRRASIVAAG